MMWRRLYVGHFPESGSTTAEIDVSHGPYSQALAGLFWEDGELQQPL